MIPSRRFCLLLTALGIASGHDAHEVRADDVKPASTSSDTASEDFPDIRDTQKPGEHPPTPDEMLGLLRLPDGFSATLFAAEPDVRQPISFDFDDRGRMWVAENYTYSSHAKISDDMHDRILILHDMDGDGRHDKRTVFWDQGRMLTSVVWGFGGAWILNDGALAFVPDRDGDDVPDSEPVAMVDGWTKGAGHNFVNGLMWGPDGWLYGRHGITDTSYPGTVDTPRDQRAPMNCGIWRFHPTHRVFEVVCHGTTNPWGLDYNASGDLFMTNNVIGHLWHVIPGAHYERMFGADFNPRLYQLMKQMQGVAAPIHEWLATTAKGARLGVDPRVLTVAQQQRFEQALLASGGELSRIALATQVIRAQVEGAPSLIFDEVDVGIGGGTAEIVGKLLKKIGSKTQVMCITHLAQVAAQADNHLKVSKSMQNKATVTKCPASFKIFLYQL